LLKVPQSTTTVVHALLGLKHYFGNEGPSLPKYPKRGMLQA